MYKRIESLESLEEWISGWGEYLVEKLQNPKLKTIPKQLESEIEKFIGCRCIVMAKRQLKTMCTKCGKGCKKRKDECYLKIVNSFQNTEFNGFEKLFEVNQVKFG